MKHTVILIATSLLLPLGSLHAAAEKPTASPNHTAYPFELPEQIRASLSVNTSQKQAVNHLLLGVNCSWPEKVYGITGFNCPEAQRLIRAVKPSSLRFPHGVWANFYDWECDGRRITDGYSGEFERAVKGTPALKYGFEGFHALHDELKFDVLFTWNVNYDSPEKGVRRLLDYRAKGFAVKWIELGNEVFWKSQRSEATSDLGKYIKVSQAHAAALKAVDPQLKVSVPVHWRTELAKEWNLPLMKQSYFDAISVHKHINKKGSAKDLGEAFAARQEVLAMGQTMVQSFPKRPIWLSEWSVSCGDAAITTLSMADTLLGILAHPEMFQIADYFQMNAKDPMFQFDKTTKTHTRTSIGAAFQVVSDVFEGSQRLANTLECTQMGKGLDAVSADAVLKDGKLTIVAINKTPRRVPLNLSVDGRPATGTITQRVLSLEQVKTFSLTENVLAEVSSKEANIVLPPLSISRIDLP